METNEPTADPNGGGRRVGIRLVGKLRHPLLATYGLFIGLAFAASGRVPRWAGWVYALGAVGYVVSFILLPVGMSVFSLLMSAVTVYIAWRAVRAANRHEVASVATA